MAKIVRYTGNFIPFGLNATGTNRTVFGDVAQSDTIDANINADFLSGWEAGVNVNGFPPKQYFNAIGFTTTQVLAYLHQLGVAEWDILQEYNTDSFTNRNGVLFVSLSDANIGNDPELDAVNWSPEILQDGSVTAAKLEDNAVTTAKILDDAVTAAKIEFNTHRKNFIINGNHDVWQRATSFVPPSATSYTADRILTTGTGFTSISRVANPDDFSTYLYRAVTSGASAGAVMWGQPIERQSIEHFKGKGATFSFKRKSAAGSFNVLVVWRDSPFSLTNQSSVVTIPMTQATTGMEDYELSITIPTPNATNTCLCFFIDVGVNSISDTIDIGQVQLEEGSVATPFEHRPIAEELALCQRYYCKSFGKDIAPSNGATATSLSTFTGAGSHLAYRPSAVISSDDASVFGPGGLSGKVVFPLPMRATPTITPYGNSTGQWWFAHASFTWSTMIPAWVSNKGFSAGSSAAIASDAARLMSGHYTADAEL